MDTALIRHIFTYHFFFPKLKIQPNYVPTLEDEVELQRQQKLKDLKDKGIKGTPVTPETFKEWQERKRKAKEEAARKLVDAELKKKKGGKGLSVLSGRELFMYKQDLFDGDFDDDQENDCNNVKESSTNNDDGNNGDIEEVAEKVKSDLFLDGDDDDLDLDDLDDE